MLAALAAVYLAASPGACASEGPLDTATAVLRAVHAENFDHAAELFRYPDSYSQEQLRAERVAIAASLRSLFGITGKVQGNPSPEIGLFASFKFTIRAGDSAHRLPEPEPKKAASFRFAQPLEHYPDGRIILELDEVAGAWRIRSISFSLPASDPSSIVSMKRLFERMNAERAARQSGTP